SWRRFPGLAQRLTPLIHRILTASGNVPAHTTPQSGMLPFPLKCRPAAPGRENSSMPADRALAAIFASLLTASTSLAAGPGGDAQSAPQPGPQPSPQPDLTPVLVQYVSTPTDADVAELEAAGAVVTRRYHLAPGLAARIPAGLEI